MSVRNLTPTQSYLKSARVLEQRGEFEEALTLYKRAVALDRHSWSTRSRHLRALYQLGRLADAEQLLTDYVGQARSVPGAALNDFGVILVEQGEPMDAINFFVQALQNPIPALGPLVLGNLAFVLYSQDRHSECITVCQNALRFSPEESRAHYILSMVESSSQASRLSPTAKIIQESSTLQVFRLLRLDGEPMAKHTASIVRSSTIKAQLTDEVPLTHVGTHWGLLVTYRDELWCGFSRQSEGGTSRTSAVIPLPAEFRLVQRRGWVRVPATGSIARIQIRPSSPDQASVEVVKVIEMNLSAGGAAVRTVPQLRKGTEVLLFLNLDSLEEVKVRARVTRVGNRETGEIYSALAFVNLEEKKREKIIRFIHRVQLRRKRRSTPTIVRI